VARIFRAQPTAEPDAMSEQHWLVTMCKESVDFSEPEFVGTV
jgi:hypothetical protein